MLCLFSPDNQGRYCQSLERCFIGKAPSIARVSRTFGGHIAESWLEIQLLDLAELSGVRKDGMTEKEYEEIARIIISGYGDFKLTEFMVFFQRFKQDKYDQFFGTFTPGTVTRSLKKFNSDRENLLRFYEDKKRQEERKREWELREKEKATPVQIQEIIDKYSKKES